jgi:hypothetical protein
MRSVEQLDISRKEHAEFMYDLGLICQDDFLDDHQNDMILIMNEYDRAIRGGSVVAFLCKQDGLNAGIVWVEKNLYGVGRVRAGLLPQYRQGFTAAHFLKMFVDFCFKTLNLRKLDAEIVLYGKEKRGSAAAEKLLRRFGFAKEGLIREALLKGGKPRDTVLLGLTRNRYEGLKHK